MLKRIHVNRHHIAANRKDDGGRPIYTIKTYKGTYTARSVYVEGELNFVDGQHKPLSCGAVAWGQTDSRVVGYDEWGKSFVLE